MATDRGSADARGIPEAVRPLVLLLAVFLILLSLPYVGRLRAALGDEGVRIPLFVFFTASAIVFVGLHLRLLRGSADRQVGLAVFLAVFGLAFILFKGPNPVVALVEKVHLLEYGSLAVLFWWAVHRRLPGPQVYAHGLLFTVFVGLLDEYVQHLLPIRVGEIRDVWINLVAGGLGLAYVALVIRPGRGRRPEPAEVWRNILLASAIFLLALGGFIHQVHLGQRIVDRDFGFSFNSRFDREGLRQRNRLHGLEWERTGARFNPEAIVVGYRAWAVEDFYVTEALRHIGARNHHLDTGGTAMAAMEQRILMRYFPAVLRALDPRLPRDVRARLRKRSASGFDPEAGFHSTEMMQLYTGITSRGLWSVIGALVIACLWGALLLHRRAGRGAGRRHRDRPAAAGRW